MAEPVTQAQRSQLRTLCEQAKQPLDENLSQPEAARRIEELQAMQKGKDQDEGRSTAAVETIVSR